MAMKPQACPVSVFLGYGQCTSIWPMRIHVRNDTYFLQNLKDARCKFLFPVCNNCKLYGSSDVQFYWTRADGTGSTDKRDLLTNYFPKHMHKLIQWHSLLLINLLFSLKLSLGFNRPFPHSLNVVAICKKMAVSSRDYDIWW